MLTEHGAKIAPSTYYAARNRPPSTVAQRHALLLPEVVRVQTHKDLGRGLYGARKVWKQLLREEVNIGRGQVENLMRTAGLKGIRRGKQFVTTRPDKAATRPPDLVDRNFTASRPNELWVVDFTYVPTWSGMAFTAFVHDVFSRRIVGWRTAASMPTELPLDALEMALWTRARAAQDTSGVVHHSDAGSQYTSIRYSERLLDAGALATIGSVGDSYDNAQAETLIGLYKTECTQYEGPWRGVDDLELATLSWVHWFNETRLHGALEDVPPIEYETTYYGHNASQPQPRPGELSLHQCRGASVPEAAAADVAGRGFGWLNGRATEERPPWGYAKLLADRLGRVESALDIDTGGGEVLAEAPTYPARMTATESWLPNAQRARDLLGPRGVEVVETSADGPLPFPDRSTAS